VVPKDMATWLLIHNLLPFILTSCFCFDRNYIEFKALLIKCPESHVAVRAYFFENALECIALRAFFVKFPRSSMLQKQIMHIQTHLSTPGYTSYIIEYRHIKVQHPSITPFDPTGVT
jgi:hypothetical protein